MLLEFNAGPVWTSGSTRGGPSVRRSKPRNASDADQARDQARISPTTRRHARWAGEKSDPTANAGYHECAHASIFDSVHLRDAVTLSNALYGRADVIEMEVLIPEALPPLDEFERIHAVWLALEKGCGFMVRDRGKGPTPAMLRAWADVLEVADGRDVDRIAQAVEGLLSELPDSVFRYDVRTVAKHALAMTENREIAFELIA